MTVSHTSSAGLKQRLLRGASVPVIVLCTSLAMNGTALAQAQTVVTDSSLSLNPGANGTQINDGFIHDDTANTHAITIDLNTADENLGDVTNANTNANGLEFNIVDSDAGVANTLTLTGNAAASNNGSIAFNVGEGTTQPVNFTVAGNITEIDSATTSIILGDNGTTVDLSFESSAATQTIDAAISVAGDADTVSVSIGNDAVSSTTTFNDTITLRDGDIITIGADAITKAVFMADVIAPGGITLESGIGGAATTATFAADVTGNISLNTTNANRTLILGADGQTTTVTGNLEVTGTDAQSAILDIADGANVTLAGNLDSGVDWNEINVGTGAAATTFTIQGNVVGTTAAMTIDNLGTLVFDTTGGAPGARSIGSAINADDPNSTAVLQTVGDASGDAFDVTFNEAVGDIQAIDTITLGDDTVFRGLVTAGNLSAAADVDVTFEALSTILTGDITGEGNLIIGDGADDTLTLGGGPDTTSTISIASIGGQGDIEIAAGSSVVMNSTVVGTLATSDFAMTGADTTLTVNSTDAIAITAGGALSLNQGTIVLGSNIGADDTAFDVASLAHGGTATVVQLSVGFTDGSVILVQSDADQTGDDAHFSLTNNALATYDIDTQTGGTQLVIIATARTAEATATQLGVSQEAAGAVLQAVTSATTVGDTVGLNALSAELNAGGARATRAANQVGIQADGVGAGSAVAFQVSGQQQDLASNRLGSLRSASDGRFASTFSDTGFSGGDLGGFYASPSEIRGSFWFEGFGGIASADGDSVAAGYDAAFGGATIGVDATINDQITVGMLGAYTASSVDGDGVGDAQMDANTYQVALYGSYTTYDFYLDGFASYAFAQNEATRTAVGQTISADYDSNQYSLGVAGGVPLEVASDVYLTPNASLTWNHYEANSYTETGSLGFSSQVNPGSVGQLTGTIGARIHAVYENFTSNGSSIVPELRVGLAYDIIDDDAVSTATFVGGGTSYSVTGTDTDDLGALLGLGLSLDNSSWSAGIAYDADLRSDYMSHTASAEYRLRF